MVHKTREESKVQSIMPETQKPPSASTVAAKNSSNDARNGKHQKPPAKKTKVYAYRSTWKHKLSRARNLAKRGGMTKAEMKAKYGIFPKKNEWWGPEENEKEWLAKWLLENPEY